MHHFIEVLRKYLVFSGRASRSEYWYFCLFYLLATVLATVVDLAAGTFNGHLGLGWVSGAFVVLTFAPTLGLSVRRLHDIGRSGWWVLVGLVPAVGALVLLVIALFDSQPGANAYGPSPKPAANERESAADPRGMGVARPSWPRRLMNGLAVAADVVLALAGSGWYWWAHHGEEFLASGRSATEEGRRAGASIDEGDCVVQALHRHTANGDLALGSSVLNALSLTGCLQTSRAQAPFCDGVPARNEAFAGGAWIAAECSQRGLSDNFCPNLFQQVVYYCSSPARAAKLNHGDKAAVLDRVDPRGATRL
jgi:uncharacterized membrane protein YhaH (DUF805 family)